MNKLYYAGGIGISDISCVSVSVGVSVDMKWYEMIWNGME